MTETWQLFLLVFSAIAIGWLLGGGLRLFKGRNKSPLLPQQYYEGLNYLINDKPDGTLDMFIAGLEVNSETLDTHIAVGNLMRRKGEVERAIRVHQNLLARPSLPRSDLHQAHLELSRDYISAGLLDRAERLLKDLVKEAPELRDIAMRHLLEIYQDEREWENAIEIAKELLPRKSILKFQNTTDQYVTIALSHYCCELAEQSMERNDFHGARHLLKQALGYDRRCVRASLLLADIEYQTGHYARALKVLQKVREQDLGFIPETIELLRKIYQQQDNNHGFQEYLLACLNDYPSASVMLALVDDIRARQNDRTAADFIGRELKRHPSLRGLGRLVELHIANSDGRARENLNLLKLLIERLMEDKPHYQCRHCGFAGKQLHWLCPSCKQWGQMKSIRGAEGD